MAKADFKTQYQESHVFPLGEKPILLAKVGVKPGPDPEHQMLSLHPQQGAGLDFNLNDQMLHSFCRLLVESTTKAEWDLDLDFGKALGSGFSELGAPANVVVMKRRSAAREGHAFHANSRLAGAGISEKSPSPTGNFGKNRIFFEKIDIKC